MAEAPGHLEQTPAGIIDWKMEAERNARLLADAERIIAEYKAQAIETARLDYEIMHLKAMLANEHQKTVPVEERNRIAQSAPETHGPLPSGEVDLTVMSDCSGAGAAQNRIEQLKAEVRRYASEAVIANTAVERLETALKATRLVLIERGLSVESRIVGVIDAALSGAVAQAPAISAADCVASYERGFEDGVFVGRETPSSVQTPSGWIDQNHQIDRYGVALMLIREGCADPAGLARRILSEFDGAAPIETGPVTVNEYEDARARFLADRADTERKQASNPSSQATPKD